MKRVWPLARPVFWLTNHLNTTYKKFMKYIFSLFLVIIFLTEHFSPLTRTADLLIKVVDNEAALCYSACDVDPLITEPEPQTDLWQHVKENISWNTYYKDKTVQQEIERIKNHGSWYFNFLSHQASPYIHYVTTELEKRGLPLELALLPFIESNYDPYAFSHGSAAGFWQMIPSTARQYGVPINSWYDGRRDIVFSTQAALDYLTYLHKRFDGDWLLAIAAYNAGEGTVSYVQRRNAAWGKGTDFWSLSLPRETKQYVPRLLALIHVIDNSSSLGIRLPELPNSARFTIVNWPTQIDLTALADIMDLQLEDIYQLNPGFNFWQSAPDGPHQLLIPVENESLMNALIADLPTDESIQWVHYKINSGDCLSKIAKNYSTSVVLIKAVNKLSSNTIIAGEQLLVPKISPGSVLPTDEHDPHYTEYKIKRGDSLWDLSKEFEVTIDELAVWNNMKTKDYLKIDQTIKLFQCENRPDVSRPETIQKVAYHVRNGDSLGRIANRFNVSVTELVNWNKKVKKQSSLIHPGQHLIIYVDITQQYFDA